MISVPVIQTAEEKLEPVPVVELEPDPEPVQNASKPSIQLSQNELRGGYGVNRAFPFSVLGGAKTPLDQIQYYSTNAAVADVNSKEGITLLSPGTAKL